MIIDSRMKAAFEDPPPERCTKCTWVRYCTRECQAADWPEHKAVCRPPRKLDIGRWLDFNAWLFRWAARAALCTQGTNLTSTHALVVDLIRTDRLVPPSERPFLVDSVYLEAHARVAAQWHWQLGAPGYTAADRAHGAALQAQGALGLALVVFRVPGPNGTSLFFFQRLELGERACGAGGGLPCAEVFARVKGVVNGDFPQDAVLALLAADDHHGLTPDRPLQLSEVVRGPKKPRRKMKDRGQTVMH
ncbi:zinc finger MYND domain-containing protein [Phanerochaete sordida]|uniref:Zinc finger MYND domain-containing protein n=1 Tax=Phanerochaete sordida TaxID=48140 RepID=A0A9P3GGW7_9APHY|nr:zinc finger MYND domain-containing protein [Phanerochaete sordida]